MSHVDPTSAPGDPDLTDAHELRFVHALQRDISRVRSLERLAHVALRHVVPYLHAARGAVLAPERGVSGLYVAAQTGAGDWDLKLAREILATGRAATPPDLLYAVLRERGKSIAVMLLSRPQAFTRAELRTLMRATEILNEQIEHLAEARIVDVLARIDHKISRELRTVDLLYQILDTLELLTRYDHSAAILLFDRERSSLEVSAEKIAWGKKKSPNIRKVLPLERDIAELLQHENHGFMLRRDPRSAAHDAATVETSVHPLRETGVEDARLLDVSSARVATLFDRLRFGADTTGPSENGMLLVPLLFGARLLGLLKLASLQPDAFTHHDIFTVGRFVEKMSTTIRNANLYGRRLAELRAINDIGKLVTRPLPVEETCASILDIVLRVMNLTAGSIELIDRDGGQLRVLASRGYEGSREGLLLGEGITGTVAQTGATIRANDVRTHPQYVMRSPEVRSELAVPIVFEGTTVGVLNVESLAPDRFSERDVDFVSIAADKSATALETLEQREHRRATLELLHELSTRLIVPEDVGRLLQETVDLTRKHLACEVASIFLFEEDRYRRAAMSGLPADWFPEESYHSGEGLTGRAAVVDGSPHPHAVFTNDVPGHPESSRAVRARYEERLASGRVLHLIAVPLVEASRPIGVLRVLNRLTRDGRLVPGGFIEADVTLLTTIASQLSLAIANFRKRERIQQMSAKLETKVRKRTEEVHRLAVFVENAPLAILEVDPGGVLRFINEAGERMFGYQAAELKDQLVIGSGIDILGEAFQDLLKVVEYMGFWAGEVVYRRSDGKTAPAFLSARALRDPAGSMRGIVIFARDVSQTKELERQLLEAEGKRAMADLAGGVAHDLNNALGSVLPMIQALQADVEEGRFDSEEFLTDLRQIESYTRLSVRIFQGMLAMSRGTFMLDKQVNVNERIQTALDLLSLRLEKSRIRVVRELQSDLPLTLAHPGRLEQVVHNLVNNALDAMPEGGTLTLRTSSDGRTILMEVEDTGVGIPQELLARVQEPFYTSKGHGTGLGLSVVRSIVWEHNGHMSMTSKVGVGTTVRIEIPIRTGLAPSEEGK